MSDEIHLRRAIRLAMNGRGGVEPNPMVGCVIVKNDRVIGEGYHQKFGEAHAEPNALASCTESPNGADVYVTLEPCCHENKKTPPCVPKLIDAKVRRVVIGCLDANPQVDGKGVAQLREAGIVVQIAQGAIAASAKQFIAPFIAHTRFGRPYVTLKWAESRDGFMAGRVGGPVRITNAASDKIVHALRSRCDAIAVGTNTVLRDDPLLTARGVETRRRLLRVVLSNTLKVPVTSRLVASSREHSVIVYSSESAVRAHGDVANELRAAGVEVVALPVRGEDRFSFTDVLHDLHRRSATHLLVEPGPTLARAMLARGQADRVWVFRSPVNLNASDVMSAPKVDYPSTGSCDVAGDVLTEYLNPTSEAFFALDASADFELARAKPAD